MARNQFVRSSKFRNVFGTGYKADKCWNNVTLTTDPHDSSFSAVNGKFLAMVLAKSGGGPFAVMCLDKPGRQDQAFPRINGHGDTVYDLAWNPFNDNQLASCSIDTTIKIWDIPDGGLTKDYNKDDAVQTLLGHSKKVLYVAWHPSASNVLVSAAFDANFIIWNTKEGTQLANFFCGTQKPCCLSWSYNGSLLATTNKDKKLRIVNSRTGEVLREGLCHVGTKPSRVTFCGTSNRLFTAGFSRTADRQYALWDSSDLAKPLTMANIDNASGVLTPFWDDGTAMVYVVGRGDSLIRYFEVTFESPYVHFLSMFQGTNQQRGGCFLPKRNLDYMKCEVGRFFKLEKATVAPITFTVPRTSDMFQEDVYPPCHACKAAMTAEEWTEGKNLDPVLARFTADKLIEMSVEESQVSKNVKMESTVKSPLDESRNENKKLKEEVKTLQEKNKELESKVSKLNARVAELEA